MIFFFTLEKRCRYAVPACTVTKKPWRLYVQWRTEEILISDIAWSIRTHYGAYDRRAFRQWCRRKLWSTGTLRENNKYRNAVPACLWGHPFMTTTWKSGFWSLCTHACTWDWPTPPSCGRRAGLSLRGALAKFIGGPFVPFPSHSTTPFPEHWLATIN